VNDRPDDLSEKTALSMGKPKDGNLNFHFITQRESTEIWPDRLNLGCQLFSGAGRRFLINALPHNRAPGSIAG
jgi:hypothetical protein